MRRADRRSPVPGGAGAEAANLGRSPTPGAGAVTGRGAPAARRRGRGTPPHRGFTLLEVLVALGVFALAAMALARLVTLSLTTASRLDERALASIVAANRIVEARTAARSPALGRSQGTESNGGITWRWTMTVAPAPDPRMVRIDVAVAGPAGGEAARLTGFRRLP